MDDRESNVVSNVVFAEQTEVSSHFVLLTAGPRAATLLHSPKKIMPDRRLYLYY